MTLRFAARLNGAVIDCTITSDVALRAPVLCFSLMAPPRVVSGGEMIRSAAGYGEVQLPDLVAGVPHAVVLGHVNPAFHPANRAWLPLGAYLRLADGTTVALPAGPAGVPDAAPPVAPPFDGLRLIPQPSRWVPAPGVLQARTFAGRGEPLEAVAALAQRNGIGPFLDADGAVLSIHHVPAMAEDAYEITLAPDGVKVTAAGRGGLFYGAVTLLQLSLTYAGALPCGTITDAPRFGWRGQHLDCARHFYAPATLHRLIDMMALFKLNRFHWHFADDEAFRLQVDCAPDLWRQTEFRGEGLPVPGVFGGGIRSGGSYSKADARALIAHAAAVNIEVLPEIEVPGHAYAMNRVIPGLRDPQDTGTERSVQGYARNAVNPAMPATWDLLEPLAAEVAALFPIGILHLGCDELAPGTWDGSPAVAALKAREGLADRDDVQGWMMAKLAAGLVAQGVRPAAWEEAAKGAQGGIGHGALMFSWSGQGPGIDAARMGHDVVMCPAQHVYLDMAHREGPEDWGATWAAIIGLEDVVNWRPVPEGAEDVAARIVGVQGTFWSEFTTADAQMEPMLAPRILGVANKAWDQADSLDGPALRGLAAHVALVFDRIGWHRHRGA